MERRCYRYTDGEAINECSELLLRSQTAENSKRLMKTVYRKMVERLSLSLSLFLSFALALCTYLPRLPLRSCLLYTSDAADDC